MTEPWNIDGLTVARAIAGDREVLGAVLAALERPLYRYISKLVARREMAEGVLQGKEVLNLDTLETAANDGIPQE